MNLDRRRFLQGTAGAAIASGLAGCLDGVVGSQPDGEGAQASFFLLYDFADRVAEGSMDVESVVPFGQHGHGWEPSGQVQRDIQQSELFVYMGEGFQPWVDDIVHNLAEDDADTHVVEAWDGVDLLEIDSSHDHDHSGDDHDEEDGHDGEEDDHDHEEHDDEEGDDRDHEEDEEHDEDDDHDHDDDAVDGDPHFWLDPVRARRAVENVRDGLIAVDEDNADAYEENAATYLDELDDLHHEFEETVDSAERDVVLVAGHNAFQYVGNRYGFEVVSIAGISPDEEPSNAAIREAQEEIEAHDIDYILAPALESDLAATQLVEETDAIEMLEISAVSGLTDEWEEEGWGYLEIMENVNLASLAKALDAE